MLTIFTPVYNRAYIIETLFQSLCKQTCFDFEWLVVDDGSTDNVADLIRQWQKQEDVPFDIRYVYQQNGGKHRAINRGVQLAKGDAFFMVDSDDYLVCDAVETILSWWSEIENDDSFAGVSGLRQFKDGVISGGIPPFNNYMDATNLERCLYNLEGEKAEVYKTELLKKYPFPEIEGENFLPQNVVWDRIGNDGYKIRWFNKVTYIFEYIEDGITRNRKTVWIKNPIGYGLCLQQLRQFYNWSILKTYFNYNVYVKEFKEYYNTSEVNFEKYLGISKEDFDMLREVLINKTAEKIGANIAIYGLGMRGNILIDLFKNSLINIVYVMDENKTNMNYKQLWVDDELPEVDAIIVTPKRDQADIISKLRDVTNNCLVTYEEWIEMMEKN